MSEFRLCNNWCPSTTKLGYLRHGLKPISSPFEMGSVLRKETSKTAFSVSHEVFQATAVPFVQGWLTLPRDFYSALGCYMPRVLSVFQPLTTLPI